MKYLIIGAGGYIGSNLLNRLTQQGGEAVAVGHFTESTMPDPNITFYNIDIGDKKMRKIFEKETPDVIYHLAGPINLRRRVDDINFVKSCGFFSDFNNILDCAKKVGVKKVIFASSGGAIYADSEAVPTSENYVICPSSLYGMANLMLEKLLTEYAKIYKTDFIVLRLSNVYGLKQWRAGETKAFVVPSFIEKIINKEMLEISGDGKQTRDFIYIDDVINALIVAAETNKMGVFNIGSGKETSLNELFAKIEKIVDIIAKPAYDSSANVGAKRSVLDISKAKKELNWQPSVSLDEGLEITVNWYNSQYAKQ